MNPVSYRLNLGASGVSIFECLGFRVLGFRVFHFGRPHNKDYSILGSVLGFPLFWETTILGGTYRDI